MAYFTHRGLHNQRKGIAENTLSAFKKSVEKGYGIEFDVRLSKDQELVVFHDEDLKRLFHLSHRISDLTYSEIKEYTLNGDTIPTLDEVLSLVAGKVTLIIELKDCHDNNLLANKVSETLDNYDGPFSVESFHPGLVWWFKKHRPHYKRGQLLMKVEGYSSFFLGCLMMTRLTHFWTRPHFYALSKDLGKTRLGNRINRILSKEIVLWTMKPQDKAYFNNADIIFEETEHPEQYW